MIETGRVEPEETWDAIVWIEVRTVEGNAAGGRASGVDVYRCHVVGGQAVEFDVETTAYTVYVKAGLVVVGECVSVWRERVGVRREVMQFGRTS